jgi:hypothetical protein
LALDIEVLICLGYLLTGVEKLECIFEAGVIGRMWGMAEVVAEWAREGHSFISTISVMTKPGIKAGHEHQQNVVDESLT